MNTTLKNIIKQTGTSIERMRDSQEDEYLLTYDNSLRICASFSHDKDAVYYNSCSWSCDAVCYVVFTDNLTYVYSPLLKEADAYETAFIMDGIVDFFGYVRRFRLKEYQRVPNYLCSQLCHLDSAILVKENDMYLRALALFWGARDGRIEGLVGDSVSMFREGFFIGGNNIIPDIQLIRKFVAHRLLDVVAAVFTTNDEPISTLEKLAISAFQGVASSFISDFVIRFLLQHSFKAQRAAGSLRITIPYLNGCSLPLQCVRLLREGGFEGRIYLTTYSTIGLPAGYYEIASGLMNDERVEWNALHDVGIDSNLEYPKDQDYIISIPPYRLYDKLMEYIHERKYDEFVEFGIAEELPFYIMAQVKDALNENGSLQLLMPEASLNISAFKTSRDKILNNYDLVSVEAMGSQVYSLGLGTMCFVRFKKHINGVVPQTVEIRWCEKSIDSLDLSIRECNIKHNGGMNRNPKLSFYRFPLASFPTDDWSPIPYSINNLKTSISSKAENSFVPVNNLFNVTSGVRSGFNQAFVIPIDQYEQFSPDERRYFTPSADRHSINNGQLTDEMFIFYPYTDGLEQIKSERDLSSKLPNYYNYIKKYKNYLLSRSKDTKRKWWDLGYHRIVHNPGTPKLVSHPYGNVGAFAYDRTGRFVVSAGYQWVAKRKSMMSDNIYYAYLSILTSDVFWKLVEMYSEPFDAVAKCIYYRLSKNAIESIPIPDLSHPTYYGIVEKLSEYGTLICHGGVEEVKCGLNKIVNEIYGYIPD